MRTAPLSYLKVKEIEEKRENSNELKTNNSFTPKEENPPPTYGDTGITNVVTRRLTSR